MLIRKVKTIDSLWIFLEFSFLKFFKKGVRKVFQYLQIIFSKNTIFRDIYFLRFPLSNMLGKMLHIMFLSWILAIHINTLQALRSPEKKELAEVCLVLS